MYEINKNISTISCAGTIIQQIGRKGNRENIFEAKISLPRKWEKPPKSEKTADLLLYEKFMRSNINPFYEGLSRKCGLLFMKKCIMRGKGFRVSPWAGRPLIASESSTRQLGVRSEEWWCGARSFDSVLTVPPLHDRTSDISLRSGWRNAPRSINNGDAMSGHSSHQLPVSSHLRLLIPSHSSLLSNLGLGACRPVITCKRGSAGSTGSEGSTGVVRRIKFESAAEFWN